MKEEEIIKILKNYNENKKEMMKETLCNAIQGLLDLYEKEKEDVVKQYELGLTQGAYEKNLVWEDKIREKVREIKDAYVEDMFMTSTRSKLDTIIALESLLEGGITNE